MLAIRKGNKLENRLVKEEGFLRGTNLSRRRVIGYVLVYVHIYVYGLTIYITIWTIVKKKRERKEKGKEYVNEKNGKPWKMENLYAKEEKKRKRKEKEINSELIRG